MPCAGAAGGCGAGVVAFLNGRLLSGSDALLDLMNFSALAADADLVVTGEGMVDDQTAGGKLVSAVAARANGTPVVVLAGGIAEGTNLEALYEKGIDKATGRVLVEVSEDFYRPTDVVNLWGDPTKAKSKLGWDPMQ